MRLSQLLGSRYKERPGEAVLESHALLLRGGYARQVANGIYSLLPPGLRVAHKIERILREEMERIGGQEVLLPLVMPKELWEASGRDETAGSELVRFSDRSGHGMMLGMAHEEAVVHLCRTEISSYTQCPFLVYQIQTKFRDEPRSRGGLVRVREFTMKDAYSFHTSQEDLEAVYGRCCQAYQRIFVRVGLPQVITVESDMGMMGGQRAHEFMLLTPAGEDTVVTSERGSYRANLEVAAGDVEAFPEGPLPLKKVHTPHCKTIQEVADFLGVATRQTAKVVFYDRDAEGLLVMAMVRGDRAVNECKLTRIIGVTPVPAEDARIRAVGAEPGYASPIGLDRRKVRVVVDRTVRHSNNLVTGANEPDYHYINFNLERDVPGVDTVDIVEAEEGDFSPDGQGKLLFHRGIELGNAFQLGDTYSAAMGMRYLDESGAPQAPLMARYGIGVGRLMSAVMETYHDGYGPKWPISVAPWQVHLCAIKYGVDKVADAAERLYQELGEAGIEVLLDDRDARPGVQFADADLLGAPFRLIVSQRNLAQGVFEWKRRDTGASGSLEVAGAAERVRGWVMEALAMVEAAAAGAGEDATGV